MTMAAAALASAASGMTVAAPRKAMTYNKLGSSDLLVSSCCLGTRASSKCPGPQPRMRPPGSAEARPLAPWTQRAAPRHVGALGWPPKPGCTRMRAAGSSQLHRTGLSAVLSPAQVCGACACSGRDCRLLAADHSGPSAPPPKPPNPTTTTSACVRDSYHLVAVSRRRRPTFGLDIGSSSP